MEDNIQTIIVVIISAFLLFIFPVYMAYEKKDDISYALAMRYTQDLVDEVRSKGYITKNMYEDYRAKLKLTGNTYDIQMTHEYNRYDPITNYYKQEDGKYTLVKTTTQEERKAYEQSVVDEIVELQQITDEELKQYFEAHYRVRGIDSVEDTYKLSKETYTTDHIVNVLNSERKLQLNANKEKVTCSDVADADDGCDYAYIMNVDDNFNITIKNTNITLATVIYNMVTANTLDDNTRIYVNYGGAILSSKWYGDIDYAKMKHDNLGLNTYEEKVIFDEERHYKGVDTDLIEQIPQNYDGKYILEFDVKPEEVTELREKGIMTVNNYTGYNFAIGNTTQFNKNSALSVSVGINGISLLTSMTGTYEANTIGAWSLPTYQKAIQKTRVVEEEYTYIDEETGETKTGVREKTETYIEYETHNRKMSDYTSWRIRYKSKGKLEITLYGKTGIPDYTGEMTVTDTNNILKGIDRTITNTYTGTGKESVNVNKNTRIDYTVTVTATTITIKAIQYVSGVETILSYPVTIEDYANIRIEMDETESKKYIASLYIDGEKVDESIEMDTVPKVSVVGKSIIGSEERFFQGYIKDVKMYN